MVWPQGHQQFSKKDYSRHRISMNYCKLRASPGFVVLVSLSSLMSSIHAPLSGIQLPLLRIHLYRLVCSTRDQPRTRLVERRAENPLSKLALNSSTFPYPCLDSQPRHPKNQVEEYPSCSGTVIPSCNPTLSMYRYPHQKRGHLRY